MSKEALRAFRAKVTEDEGLRTEMTRSLGHSGVPIGDFVEFIRARGFDVTVDDVRASAELDDDELEAVAGGVRSAFFSLGGVGGAALDDKHKVELDVVSFSWGDSL